MRKEYPSGEEATPLLEEFAEFAEQKPTFTHEIGCDFSPAAIVRVLLADELTRGQS